MRKVRSGAHVIFYSHRGVQYASDTYRKFLKNKDIKPSMSRKGKLTKSFKIKYLLLLGRPNPFKKNYLKSFITLGFWFKMIYFNVIK